MKLPHGHVPIMNINQISEKVIEEEFGKKKTKEEKFKGFSIHV